ncbi:MAG TPA: DUF1631 domain-containing protein [Rudaea sp.]|nr:DUF1631 domain-containing protein [Rudaea sp.]
MNTSGDDGKIVDLQQRQSQQSFGNDRLGELLRAVRGTALKRLQALVSALFENIDDALFDLAEKAESNAVQTVYFEGMRKVRLQRQTIEQTFQEQFSRLIGDFAAGKLRPAKAESAVHAQSGGALSLVDDTELEESLAITSAIAKAENRLAPPLNALNQRLSVLRGGSSVEDATNPVAPAHLGQAFRVAMRPLELSVNSRLIIFKLFDRYVLANLGDVYDEINAQLIQAGVLPQIRYALPPGSKYAPGQAPAPAADGTAGQAAVAAEPMGDVAAQLQVELYNTVRSLLATRRAALAADPNYVASPAGAPNMSITELLSVLTLLQTSAPAAPAVGGPEAARLVHQVKRELLDQAGRFHGNAVGVAGADEETIDLVGMLFEYILQDRNLPAQMQAQLGRLQIPFLKAAILDKHLFAQKSHPARQLLDSMAHACLGWSEESDKDGRLHEKVKQVVESLLKDFDDDLDIFEKARLDFEAFLDTNRKRADLAEQRAAEATRGREKLHAARRTSAREVLQRVEGREMPEIVRTVLTRPWANYLVLTLLRQGEDSNEWRQALRFADEFVWSAQPKPTDAERLRLRGMLPLLEKALRHGLATVAYHENDVKQLMQELNQLYTGLLGGAPSVPGLEIVSRAAAAAAAIDSPVEEEIVLRAEAAAAPPDPLDDDECVRQAKSLKVGAWIELTGADGAKERAKLSWISPISSKYLFVNRKGLKVADKTVQVLAAEIRRGEAVVLEEVPLFDRALDAIVERLKAAQAKTDAPTA